MKIMARDPEAVSAIVAVLTPSLTRALPMIVSPRVGNAAKPPQIFDAQRVHIDRFLERMPRELSAAVQERCCRHTPLMFEVLSASLTKRSRAIRDRLIFDFHHKDPAIYTMIRLSEWLNIERTGAYKAMKRVKP